MSEQFKHKDSLSSEADGQDVLALLKKMQTQLVSLEGKIDVLINQPSEMPSRGMHFSKPFRSFGRSHYHSDSATGNAVREKGFERKDNYKKSYSGTSRGFGYKNKAYGSSRESNFGKDRPFARRNDGKKEGFDQKKKPFSYKRRDSGR